MLQNHLFRNISHLFLSWLRDFFHELLVIEGHKSADLLYLGRIFESTLVDSVLIKS